MFYFHKDPRSTKLYHLRRSCDLVPAEVSSNPDWMLSNLAPKDRERCPHCGGQGDGAAGEIAAETPR